MDQALEFLASLQRHWDTALVALDGVGMIVALVLLASILAAVGGMVNGRMRLSLRATPRQRAIRSLPR